MMEGLASAGAERKTVMIGATYLKAHRTASSLRAKKGDVGHLIGHAKGDINNKLHAVTDANDRPQSFFMTTVQVSDDIGATALLDELPKARWLLADLVIMPTRSVTPYGKRASNPTSPASPSNTTSAVTASRSCSATSKDWRRVAPHYDRCATAFFSAITLAATVIFWL